MTTKTTLTALLLFSVLFSFAQEKYIQVEMEDQSINYDYVGAPTYYYNMPPDATDYSNDTGLNNILMGNNVTAYDFIESSFFDDLELGNRVLVVCDNCDHNQLAANLIAYSSVIKNAYPLDDRYSYNELLLKINDVSIGIPTGMNNGVITTNDAGLNTIFTTHNVYFYKQLFPSSMNNSLLRSYALACDCDATVLKTDLDAYIGVIELTEAVYIESQLLLSTPEAAFSDVKVYPNPVENVLNISNTTNIKSLEIYAIQGQKVLTETSQFASIDMSKLKSGLYFVKLTDATNNSSTFKIIKK